MGQCYLKLYDGFNYSGHLATFTSSAYNGNSNSNDRDASGTVTGDCKNTTWLGFEHPGEGGHAWIMGEGGSLPNFRDAYDKCNVKDRKIHNFHDQNNSIKRIDIPTQNINEGRMRQDITIYANRRDTRNCQWATYPKITKTSDGKYNAADSDQWLVGHNDKKGKACPGGEAFWKGFRKISCVYDVKTGSGLGRIRELHGEIKNTFSGDPRKAMFDKIADDYCDRADRLDDKITSGSGSDSTCRGFSNAKALAKDYCKNGDKIKTDTMLCTNESDSLGPTLYDELASKYCDANPNDPFCGCYNVVTNKCKGEDIDKEIKRLEDGRKAIEGVRYVWFGFDNKTEYLNIAQIEVYSDGVNIVKDIDDSKVTVGSQYNGTQYLKNQLFDGNYESIYHSGREAGWKTTSNKRYDYQKVKYVSLGYGADVSYNAELGEDEDVSAEDCKKKCASLPKCKSTLYNKYGKSCHMTSSTPGGTSTRRSTRHDIIEKIGDAQHNYVKIDLGKEYKIDQVKIFNRKSCGSKESNNICNDRWAGSYVKLLRSNGSLIKASEKVVGDYKQGGERVITFFDNGVGAAKAKLTIPGCKITVPIRRTLNNLPPSIPQAALDGADKCWGNVCGPLNEIGGDNFVPENAIVAGGICSKSMTICNVDLSAGNLQDSEINIEQKCGEYEGEPSPMSPPSSNEPSEPSDGSTDGTPAPMGGTPSVPSTSSSTPSVPSTSSVVAGTASTEEKAFYEKSSVQIGTVASSSCSIFSCLILIMLTM